MHRSYQSRKSDVRKSSKFLVFTLLLARLSPATNSPLNTVFTFTQLCFCNSFCTCLSTRSLASRYTRRVLIQVLLGGVRGAGESAACRRGEGDRGRTHGAGRGA